MKHIGPTSFLYIPSLPPDPPRTSYSRNQESQHPGREFGGQKQVLASDTTQPKEAGEALPFSEIPKGQPQECLAEGRVSNAPGALDRFSVVLHELWEPCRTVQIMSLFKFGVVDGPWAFWQLASSISQSLRDPDHTEQIGIGQEIHTSLTSRPGTPLETTPLALLMHISTGSLSQRIIMTHTKTYLLGCSQ